MILPSIEGRLREAGAAGASRADRPVAHAQPLTVHIACEVCHEHLLVAAPWRSTRYGAVDCPGCGTGYVFRVAPVGARRPEDPPAPSSDPLLLVAP